MPHDQRSTVQEHTNCFKLYLRIKVRGAALRAKMSRGEGSDAKTDMQTQQIATKLVYCVGVDANSVPDEQQKHLQMFRNLNQF